MRRSIFITVLICLFIFPCAGETFFICTSETCADETVPLDEQVREGILDGLFEQGHIVLDDCHSEIITDILKKSVVDDILSIAAESGIRFTVIVRVRSKRTVLPNRLERLETIAEFSLYDAETKKAVASSNARTDNTGKEEQLGRKKLWFALGQEISSQIQSMYAESVSAPASTEKVTTVLSRSEDQSNE